MDDYFTIGKILSIAVMVITRSVFQEGNKYYLQLLLHECVYKLTDELQKVCIVLSIIFFITSIYFYWH